LGIVRKYLLIGLAVIAVVAVGVLQLRWHLLGGGSTATAGRAAYANLYRPGRPVPAAAAATARKLVTGTAAEQRAALSPALAAVLPAGAMFPPGSTISLGSDSWEQAGQYANVTGELTEPGSAAAPVAIGFVEAGGGWLVTFEEPLS
jgi:hypothetical protein